MCFKLPADLAAIKLAIAAVIKCNNKKKKRKRKLNTAQDLIEKGRWPQNGILELQHAVQKMIPWCEHIIQNGAIVDKPIYDKFISMLCASVYCFCPNGRVQAIMDMRMKQLPEIIKKGYVFSSVFKTNARYGEQPVSFDHHIVQYLLKHYIQYFRPRTLFQPDDPLFIQFNGAQYDIGRGVTRFFKKELRLDINTTLIRSFVETNMDRQLKSGNINALERGAVMNVNGHTSQVVQDYYLHEDRVADRTHSSAAFQKWVAAEKRTRSIDYTPFHHDASIPALEPLSIVNTDDEPLSDDFTTDNLLREDLSCEWVHDLEYADTVTAEDSFEQKFNLNNNTSGGVSIQYGELHPNKDANAKRIKWTQEEIKIVGHWCEDNLLKHPEWSSIIVSRCLTFIKGDYNARKYFHPNHVTDSTKLRHAYIQFKENRIFY